MLPTVIVLVSALTESTLPLAPLDTPYTSSPTVNFCKPED